MEFHFERLNQMSIRDVDRLIGAIVSSAENGATVDELRSTVVRLATHCPFETFVHKSPLRVLRAQKLDDERFCDNISRLSYPPPHLIRKLGRANRESSPILYAAPHGRTVIFESRPVNGGFFAIIEYSLRNGTFLNMQHVGLIGTNFGHLSHKSRLLQHGYPQKMGLTKYGIRNVLRIHQNLGRLFMRDILDGNESEYAITVSIAEFLLSYPASDGLIFPSKRSSNDYNFAIKPKSADEKLIANRVFGFQVVDASKTDAVIRHLATSERIDGNGNIEWVKGEILPIAEWFRDLSPAVAA